MGFVRQSYRATQHRAIGWGTHIKTITTHFLAACALVLSVWVPLYIWAGTPVVVVSRINGDCVTVHSPGAHSCAQLPKRYETQWGP